MINSSKGEDVAMQRLYEWFLGSIKQQKCYNTIKQKHLDAFGYL
jgi:hypothetical protein